MTVQSNASFAPQLRETASFQVAIVQRRLTHYRVPLFEAMRLHLSTRGVLLRILHGEPTAQEAMKRDGGRLDWAEPLPARYLANGRIVWLPYANRTTNCELVIVSHENKLINNLPLLLSKRQHRPLVALWGHGRNMQAKDRNSWRERFKRWPVPRADWWFAYSELSAKLVNELGFPRWRTTVLNNSIDTVGLRADIERARQHSSRAELRQRLGLAPGDGATGVFIGSLYAEKRIALLIESARAIQRKRPDFQLAVAGDGPERELLRRAAAESPFIKWLGGVHGLRKAELLAAGDLVLNPGLVGLGILDAFAAGLPLVTTDCGLHSPEIAYLEPGRNGLMTAETPADFAQAVVGLIERPQALAALALEAERAGCKYTLENMVARFSDGILQCLAHARP